MVAKTGTGAQNGTRTFCPGCRDWHDGLVRDRAGNARGCPRCGSLERHRLLAVLLPALATLSATALRPVPATTPAPEHRVLDVAPSRALDPALDRLPGFRRMRIDFDPGADGRLVDVRASVTALPLADRSIDLLVCSHVLEHVPDDAVAMRELARVISATGIGIVVVPIKVGVPTDEDPSAPAEERLRRFGQADHVRYYGDDFDHRLAAAGLAVSRLETSQVVDPWLIDRLRLMPDEHFWLVRPVAVDGGLPDPAELRAGIGAQLGDALAAAAGDAMTLGTLRERARHWETSAAQWQARYVDLRDHRAVNTLIAVNRVRRRALSRLRGQG